MSDEEKPIEITVGGKTLQLSLDIPAMRRLRRYPDPIDIMKVVDPDNKDGGLIGQLSSDPGIAVDIIWEASEGDPNRPETAEDFAKGIAGDKLDEYQDKALDLVIRFTPDRKIRAVLHAVKSKAVQAQEALGDKMIESIEDGTLDLAIAEVTKEALKSEQKKIDAEEKKLSKTGSSKNARSSGSSTSKAKGGSTGSR